MGSSRGAVCLIWYMALYCILVVATSYKLVKSWSCTLHLLPPVAHKYLVCNKREFGGFGCFRNNSSIFFFFYRAYCCAFLSSESGMFLGANNFSEKLSPTRYHFREVDYNSK